jgi:hypothetical protein
MGSSYSLIAKKLALDHADLDIKLQQKILRNESATPFYILKKK